MEKSNIGPARQISFVSNNMHQSMLHMSELMSIGPWYYEPEIRFRKNRYRGQHIDAPIAAAISYSGEMQFEIIQPLNKNPSIYTELAGGPEKQLMLHHMNMWVRDIDEAVDQSRDRGFEVIQESSTGLGDLVYLIHPDFNAMVLEISNLGDEKSRIFNNIKSSSQNWNGLDPIRKGFPL